MAQKKKKDYQLLKEAASAAIKLVQDPRVQDQISKAVVAVADKLKQVKQRRARQQGSGEGATTPATSHSFKGSFPAWFGNQKLERRVQNLSENLRMLRGSVDGSEAAEALDEVENVVAKLEVAVSMAANLPVGKRQRAHWEIDSVLDDVERAVFASVMP